MTCPHCARTERQVQVGRNTSGSQYYECKACGHKYMPAPHTDSRHTGSSSVLILVANPFPPFKQPGEAIGQEESAWTWHGVRRRASVSGGRR